MKDKEKEIFYKICRFCSYRERCISEVVQKMNDKAVESSLQEKIITLLLEENFINETRYAQSYVRGKFRTNHWGRVKIRQYLKSKGINNQAIEIGFKEIDEDVYIGSILRLIESKNKQVKDNNNFIRRKKIADYLIRKGFESDLVWENINQKLPK